MMNPVKPRHKDMQSMRLVDQIYHEHPKPPKIISRYDYINGRDLSQLGEDGLLHPVTFFTKNLNLNEYNYEIYDKEL